ncbi:hypothetical protein [Italian clover phyllody phytoplasma]|uniref:hypothetical protein n=1 Tax=Italian clover phyllody phytoplasma TaxID=1196420 RepID=UPI0002FDC8FD|nr:hypothetical protein [Italian clover phyllody phytoplasma]
MRFFYFLKKRKGSNHKEALIKTRNDNVLDIHKNINEYFLKQKSSKVIEHFNQKNNYEWEFEVFNPKNNKIVKVSLFICHCPVQNYFKCKDCNKMG